MILGFLLFAFASLMLWISALRVDDRKYAIMDQVVDEKTFNLVSQLGHAAGGLAVAWGSYVFWGWHGSAWSMLALAILVAIKEWYWDNKYESVEVRGSNLLDFSMWMAGSGVANLLIWLRLSC